MMISSTDLTCFLLLQTVTVIHGQSKSTSDGTSIWDKLGMYAIVPGIVAVLALTSVIAAFALHGKCCCQKSGDDVEKLANKEKDTKTKKGEKAQKGAKEKLGQKDKVKPISEKQKTTNNGKEEPKKNTGKTATKKATTPTVKKVAAKGEKQTTDPAGQKKGRALAKVSAVHGFKKGKPGQGIAAVA